MVDGTKGDTEVNEDEDGEEAIVSREKYFIGDFQ